MTRTAEEAARECKDCFHQVYVPRLDMYGRHVGGELCCNTTWKSVVSIKDMRQGKACGPEGLLWQKALRARGGEKV